MVPLMRRLFTNMRTILARIANRFRRSISSHFGNRMVEVTPKFPVISFTFDDFPQSALRQGGSILEGQGVRGTYYVSIGSLGKNLPAGPGFLLKDLQDVLERGHELGCHTFSHCDAWKTTPDLFERSIIENQRALTEMIAGPTLRTLSYPIAFPRPGVKRRAGRHFSCCRGGGDSYNFGTIDANNLRALFLEKYRDDLNKVVSLINANVTVGGWLIFATHDIRTSPSQFGCTPAFFEGVVGHAAASGAKILPVAEAWDILTNS
jgi:peptidoglycan/xylan/chitin deacetylase (PgdA/CDA1 family)